MVQQTSKGLPYPEPTDNAQLWTHIQNLATAVDGLLIAVAEQTQLTSALGAWTSYTPSWSTITGANLPSFGNAVLECRYVKIGKTVLGKMDIGFGSSTNFGGGGGADNYLFGLPTPALGTDDSIGFLELVKDNGTRSIGRARLASTSTFAVEISTGTPSASAINNVGEIDAISPWTWANTHWIKGVFHYESS